jgi:ADP-ribose pyrophosphatase YjhB (NUDIX family)
MKPRRTYNKLYTEEDLKDHSGIAAVIKDKEGNVLVQRHTKLGLWTIPAGKCKEDEEPEYTLNSEIFEETGLVVISAVLIKDRVFHYIKNDIPVSTHIYLYEVVEYTGEVQDREPEKHSSQVFMDPLTIRAFGKQLSDVTVMWLEDVPFPFIWNSMMY